MRQQMIRLARKCSGLVRRQSTPWFWPSAAARETAVSAATAGSRTGASLPLSARTNEAPDLVERLQRENAELKVQVETLRREVERLKTANAPLSPVSDSLSGTVADPAQTLAGCLACSDSARKSSQSIPLHGFLRWPHRVLDGQGVRNRWSAHALPVGYPLMLVALRGQVWPAPRASLASIS